MMKKAEAQARRLLAEAVSTVVRQVPKDARFDQLDRWDSLAHMRLILAMEEQLARPLSTEEILSIESLADIAKILSS